MLHHFASKELLYRALLETLAQDLMQRMDRDAGRHRRPGSATGRLCRRAAGLDARAPLAAQLVTRELLDNSERIATAQTRPLERF